MGEVEIWKDVVGWEGVYQISNHGRLKSFKKHQEGRILLNNNRDGWYLNVVLQQGGRCSRRWSVKLHTLVALHFVGPRPSKKHHVNHKDMDKQNNRATNLEWVTARDNVMHAISHKPEMVDGMIRRNVYRGVIQFTLSGEYVRCFRNALVASQETGVCQRNICQVANGTEYKPGKTRKSAGGFKWENMIPLGGAL